ncbi:MAG: sugar diacid recognition domain-containing protein [Thermodesulfobacteriota bacterium]
MLISDELAQKIVDTAQCLVHRNVNVMNRDGVIVGTSQPQRYGSRHKGAQDVLETGAEVDIYPTEVGLYPGSLPGVNLPLVLDGQIIGVVGVTGEPDEVRSTARLVKAITELIIERELLQQEASSRLRLKEQLAELLLWQNDPGTQGRIRRAAKALGLDLGLPRVVAVADVSGPAAALRARQGGNGSVLDRAAESILRRFAEGPASAGCDLAVVLQDRLVAFRPVAGEDPRVAVREWTGRLEEAFAGWRGGEVRCGVGAAARAVAEYPSSLRQAEFCLRMAGAGALVRTVYDTGLAVGYLLAEAASGPGGMLLRSLFPEVEALLDGRERLAETLEALLSHNLEMEATAHALGIHRNTLAYRLGRIQDATGLDPARRLDHAVLLRVALLVRSPGGLPAVETAYGRAGSAAGAS